MNQLGIGNSCNSKHTSPKKWDSVDVLQDGLCVAPIEYNRLPKQSKAKAAPRSLKQFKIGPPFGETSLFTQVYSWSTNCSITPVISARIDRGFDDIDNKWVGYKRNYFTLAAAFRFKEKDSCDFSGQQFYISADNNAPSFVRCFWVNIGARCLNDNLNVYLIQHSPKREKEPHLYPQPCFIVPGSLPQHEVIKQSANLRSSQRINEYKGSFHYAIPKNIPPESILHSYPHNQEIFVCAKYERIQFSTTPTLLNLRNTMINRTFALEVLLFATIEDGTNVLIAKTETGELVVRGRSPSTYKIAKKSKEVASVPDKQEQLSKIEKVPKGSCPSLDASNRIKPITQAERKGSSQENLRLKLQKISKSIIKKQGKLIKLKHIPNRVKRLIQRKIIDSKSSKTHRCSKMHGERKKTPMQSSKGPKAPKGNEIQKKNPRKEHTSSFDWIFSSTSNEDVVFKFESDWLLDVNCPTSELDDFIPSSTYDQPERATECYNIYDTSYFKNSITYLNNKTDILDNSQLRPPTHDECASEFMILSRGTI